MNDLYQTGNEKPIHDRELLAISLGKLKEKDKKTGKAFKSEQKWLSKKYFVHDML